MYLLVLASTYVMYEAGRGGRCESMASMTRTWSEAKPPRTAVRADLELITSSTRAPPLMRQPSVERIVVEKSIEHRRKSGFPSAAGVSVMSSLWHGWLCS